MQMSATEPALEFSLSGAPALDRFEGRGTAGTGKDDADGWFIFGHDTNDHVDEVVTAVRQLSRTVVAISSAAIAHANSATVKRRLPSLMEIPQAQFATCHSTASAKASLAVSAFAFNKRP